MVANSKACARICAFEVTSGETEQPGGEVAPQSEPEPESPASDTRGSETRGEELGRGGETQG